LPKACGAKAFHSSYIRSKANWQNHRCFASTEGKRLAKAKEENFEVYWWRDRDKEVDFVLKKGKDITALEVKSGRVKHIGGYLDFKKKHPQARCLVIGDSNCSLEEFLLGEKPLY